MRLALAVLFTASTLAIPPNDHLFVLGKRAGPLRYATRAPHGDYAAALAAFGAPTTRRVDGNLCRVTWDPAGVTIDFASDLHPCGSHSLGEATWYGMRLFGRGWHTTRGIRIGSSVAAVRRLYPTATLDKATGRLDLVTRRDEELHFVLLAVEIADGKVTAIDAPGAFVY
jgi:hypothetical protein